MSEPESILVGAKAYTMWAGFWPSAAGPFAKPMNEIPKVVFSDSLATGRAREHHAVQPRHRRPRLHGAPLSL